MDALFSKRSLSMQSEIDEDVCSCELFFSSSALEFEDLYLNTQHVELKIELFRRGNFDSNED